jgi:hypothetical protein
MVAKRSIQLLPVLHMNLSSEPRTFDEVESQIIQGPEKTSSAVQRSNAAAFQGRDESATVPSDLAQRRIKRLRRKKGMEQDYHAAIKYSSLVLLVAQMVGLVLLMRYSRTHKNSNGDLYLASTAVFVMEVCLFVSTCIRFHGLLHGSGLF